MPPTSKEIVIPIEESDSQIHQQAEENLEQENTENPEETSDRELEIEEPEQDDNCQENDGDQILCHGISEEKLHQGFSGKTKALNNEDLVNIIDKYSRGFSYFCSLTTRFGPFPRKNKISKDVTLVQ